MSITATALNASDLVKGFISVQTQDDLVADARSVARTMRMQSLVNVFESIRSKTTTGVKLARELEFARSEGHVLPEDFNVKTDKEISYVKVAGELLLLPGDDLPATAQISKLWIMIKQVGPISISTSIIRRKGQTVGAAYEAIKALADAANEEKRNATADPEKLLKAAFGPYGKAIDLIKAGAEITPEIKAMLAAFVAGAQAVVEIDNTRNATTPNADGGATVTVITGEIAA